MKASKPFDPAYDYSKDLGAEDTKEENGRLFVYLRGLEKLAKERGVVKAICARLQSIPDGAMCTYHYEFVDGGVYEGSADATTKNCDGDFRLYTTAMAESRAKARALRTAFGITLCSVEEKANVTLLNDDDLGQVEDHQATLIRHLMEKHEIGKVEVLQLLDLPRKIAKVEDLTRIEARELIGKLNSFKKKKAAKA